MSSPIPRPGRQAIRFDPSLCHRRSSVRRLLLDLLCDSFTDDGTRGQHHDSTACRTARPIRAGWPLLRDGGGGCRTGRFIAIGFRRAQPGDERLCTGLLAGGARHVRRRSPDRHHRIVWPASPDELIALRDEENDLSAVVDRLDRVRAWAIEHRLNNSGSSDCGVHGEAIRGPSPTWPA